MSTSEVQLGEIQREREFLLSIAHELMQRGLEMNWSAHEGSSPAALVNKTCLLRVSVDGSSVYGKFWGVEDKVLAGEIKEILGKRVIFADYCFDIGGPQIGESIH